MTRDEAIFAAAQVAREPSELIPTAERILAWANALDASGTERKIRKHLDLAEAQRLLDEGHKAAAVARRLDVPLSTVNSAIWRGKLRRSYAPDPANQARARHASAVRAARRHAAKAGREAA